MPLEKIDTINSFTWGLWKISEDERTLANEISSFEKISDSITHSQKRLEWLAARVLAKRITEKLGLIFLGITKDEFGKPYLTSHNYQLSLSHSYPYVAALLHPTQPVGIDLEQPKGKLLRIAPRILEAGELANAGQDIIKHCIYWCAKETLIKVHGKKDLTFAEHLKIDPFDLEKEGDLVGRIIVDGNETKVSLWYSFQENFVVVLSQ
jgi:4'-phosphopantetheinyl transferase